MAFFPDQITKEHILKAVSKIEEEQIDLIPSTRWVVEINGKTYPPKEVMRYAHEAMNGEKLWENIGGGEPTNKYLMKFGFEIKEKGNAINKIIETYKKHIQENGFEDEIYKWELLDKYHGQPSLKDDIIMKILEINYSNLIYQMSSAVIKHLANDRPFELRECLLFLFDEQKPLQDRINYYSSETLKVYRQLIHDSKLSHHQDERTIATFLTFKYPEKYSFYKNSFYQGFCKLLGVKAKPKGQKYVHYLELLSHFIEEYIITDEELLDLQKNKFPSTLTIDVNHNILAQDILYQIFDKEIGQKRKYWRIGTTDDTGKSYWTDMKNNNRVSIGWSETGDLSLYELSNKNDVIQLFKEKGFYKEDNRTLSKKAGEFFNFYSSIKNNDIILAQDGQKVLGIGIVNGEYLYDESIIFYHHLPVHWINLNPELINRQGLRTTVFPISELSVIDQIDKLISLQNEPKKETMKTVSLNQILYGPPGTGKTYKLQHDYVDKFTILNKTELKDDFIKNLIINATWWEVIALILLREGNLSVPQINQHPYLRIKHEASNNNNSGTMIWAMLQIHTDPEAPNVHYKNRGEPYIFRKLENSVWQLDVNRCQMDAPQIEELNSKIENFKERQEQSVNYRFTTFHQSYSYEDFIEGIKPNLSEEFTSDQSEIGYVIEKGVFYRCCDEACKLAGFVSLKDCLENYTKEQRIEKFQKAQPFAFFIDEINRANVSSVLGELITLIEEDKRLSKRNELIIDELPYSKKPFGVPPNLYIIGTMNTADRSVEALDAALRRRFSFEEMPPRYDLEGLDYEFEGFKSSNILKTINRRIEKILDKDHLIGHSYFIKNEDEDAKSVLEKALFEKIIPLLQEYFYGDIGKINLILGNGFMTKENGNNDIFPDSFYDKAEYLEREIYKLIPRNEVDLKDALDKMKIISD